MISAWYFVAVFVVFVLLALGSSFVAFMTFLDAFSSRRGALKYQFKYDELKFESNPSLKVKEELTYLDSLVSGCKSAFRNYLWTSAIYAAISVPLWVVAYYSITFLDGRFSGLYSVLKGL